MIKRIVKRIIQLRKEKEVVPIMKVTDLNSILQGKVALITGGSSGIGFAMAESFLKSGCKVIIAGTNQSKLVKRCEELSGIRGAERIKSLLLDVKDVPSMKAKILEAAGLFEEGKIDILVNSAGVHTQAPFPDITEEEWDNIIDTNLKGVFFLSQEMGRYMIDHKIKGHILNVSSSGALRPAWGPYFISKWGIKGFTLGLAQKLQPYGIVVNAIAPGQTATPMLGKDKTDDIYNGYALAGRYIMPDEIAALATFMVSDLGNMIVGDTFYMTGGSAVVSMEH